MAINSNSNSGIHQPSADEIGGIIPGQGDALRPPRPSQIVFGQGQEATEPDQGQQYEQPGQQFQPEPEPVQPPPDPRPEPQPEQQPKPQPPEQKPEPSTQAPSVDTPPIRPSDVIGQAGVDTGELPVDPIIGAESDADYLQTLLGASRELSAAKAAREGKAATTTVEATPAPEPTPAPVAEVAEAPAAVEPPKVDIPEKQQSSNVDVKPTPMGEASPYTLKDPNPRVQQLPEEDRAVMTARSFSNVAKDEKKLISGLGKQDGRGQGMTDMVVSDDNISPMDIAYGVNNYIGALRHPESDLREVMLEYLPDFNIDKALVDKAYAAASFRKVFNENDIYSKSIKYPTPAESDAHNCILRVHGSYGCYLHPTSAKAFNADHDGDAMFSLFKKAATRGVKFAMDFLIGMDGEPTVDKDIFNMHRWGTNEEIGNLLREAFKINNIVGLDEINFAGLVKSVADVADGKKGSMKSLLKWVRDAGIRPFPNDREKGDKQTAAILAIIYKFNAEFKKADTWVNFNEYMAPKVEPVVGERSPAWDEDLIEATTPANMFDFFAQEGYTSKQYPGKNQIWRKGASAAKRVKALSDIKTGTLEWKNAKYSKSFTGSQDELVAKQMSGLTTLNSSSFGSASYLRAKTINGVAGLFPGASVPKAWKKDFVGFVKRFCENYNYAQAILENSNVVMYADGTSSEGKLTYHRINYKGFNQNFIAAFKRVYGDYPMSALFDSKFITGYGNITLNEYIAKSRVAKMIFNDDVKGTKVQGQKQFIAALLDSRTGAAQVFDQEFELALAKQFNGGKIKDIDAEMKPDKSHPKGSLLHQEMKMTKTHKSESLRNLLEARYLLGPDAAAYFGLDSDVGMMNNEFGLQLIGAPNADMLGGRIYMLQGKYRLAKAYQYQQTEDWDRFNQELDSIASISDLWNALIIDFRSGGKAIDDILLNPTMGKREKANRLRLMRNKVFPKGNRYFLAYEVTHELMADPKPLYAGPGTIADYSIKALTEDFKGSSQKIDSYVKNNYEIWQNQVAAAHDEIKEGELQEYLDNCENNKLSDIDFDKGLMVDAITSCYEKNYSSSEKSSQEEAVKGAYEAVCTLKNGGIWSDLAMSDDFSFGKISLERLANAPVLIGKILRDKSISVKVYDAKHSFEFNQRNALGFGELEVWDNLKKNPRLAMALRTTASSIYQDTTYTVAKKSLKDTVKRTNAENALRNKAWSLMVDHPGFFALSAVGESAEGMKRPQVRKGNLEMIERTLDLIHQVAGCENIGQTAQRIADVMLEGWEDSGVAEIEIKQMNGYLAKTISAYATEFKGIGYTGKGDIEVTKIQLTQQQVDVYFDVIQVLSGAKTETSTSINGAESQHNAPLVHYASYVPDDCGGGERITLTEEEFRENWEKYERWNTDDIVSVDETTVERIIEAAAGGPIVVNDPATCTHDSNCPCKRHRMADPSTNLDPDTQTPPLARELVDKRTQGTEGNNLKGKKFGDDGTDSISKFDVIEALKGAKKRLDAIQKAYDTSGLFEARREMGRQMMDVNLNLYGTDVMSYNSLNEHDYANIAQSLILENEAEHTIEILSIGELSAMSKQVLSDLITQNNEVTATELRDEMIRRVIARKTEQKGTTPIEADIAQLSAIARVNTQNRASTRTMDRRRSSEERNAELVTRILKELPHKGPMEDAIKTDEKLRKKYPKAADFLPAGQQLTGVATKNSTADLNRVIGPRSMWVIGADMNQQQLEKVVNAAKRNYINVVFTDNKSWELFTETPKYIRDIDSAYELESGAVIVPYFDMELNGPNTSYYEGASHCGVHTIDENSVDIAVEDIPNEFNLADSDVQPCQALIDNTKVERHGDYPIDVNQAFSIIRKEFPDNDLILDMPSKIDIGFQLVEGQDMPRIDVGYTTKNKYTLQENDEAINRYRYRWDETDENGWLTVAEPEEIVGWIRCQVDQTDVVAWHPVRMYDKMNTKAGSPPAEEFTILGYNFDAVKTNRFMVKWEYIGSLLGKLFKIFEENTASNKHIARPTLPQNEPDRTLRNGLGISYYVAAPSTTGRRTGYQMQSSMATLMAMARLTGNGYNFAETEGSFPDPKDAEFKEKLRNGDLRIGDWVLYLEENFMEFFPRDMPNVDMMNTFMNDMVRKAIKGGVNPSDVLAYSYNGVKTRHWFRFNILFSGSLQFRDNLMAMFNYIDPTLCPPNSHTESDKTLFNNNLQMLVPSYDADGNRYEIWQFVYVGLHFFDEHFSGFSPKGRNPVGTASPSVDNTLMFGGQTLSLQRSIAYNAWSLQDKPLALSGIWATSAFDTIEEEDED